MSRIIPDFSFERAVLEKVPGALLVGVDEAGRGPLAGPVVACAAALKNESFLSADAEAMEAKEWRLVRDSKALTVEQREKAFAFVEEYFHIGVGIIGSETIDRVNILEATFLAMKSALAALKKRLPRETGKDPYLLIDGNQVVPNLSLRQEAVVGGDGRVRTIAAASIIAKVTRDRILLELDRTYLVYGFAQHKGYGTKAHMDALRKYGPSPVHRMSFRPVFLSVPENANRRFFGR
jgi:ribonuclease HII